MKIRNVLMLISLFTSAVAEETVYITKKLFESRKQKKTLDALLKTREKQNKQVRVKGCPECDTFLEGREEALGLFGKKKTVVVVSPELAAALKKGGVSADIIKKIQELGQEEALKRLNLQNVSPQQAAKKIKEMGSTQATEALEVPAPPPPPPPSALLGKKKAVAKPKVKKEKKPHEYILAPLSKEELDKLTQKQKDESDYILLQALHKINNRYAKPDDLKKIKPKKLRIPTKGFKNRLDLYVFYILDMLVDQVGQDKKFYKREELKTIIQKFDSIVGKEYKITSNEASFLLNKQKRAISKQLGAPVLSLFAAAVFDQQKNKKRLNEEAETLAINCIVSQRSVTQPTQIKKASSDGEISSLFDQLINKASKVNIAAFIRELNIKRIDPDFMKFDSICLGLSEEAQFTGINRKKIPLMSLLHERDPGKFDPGIIILAIPDQLFFSREEFTKVIPLQSPQLSTFRKALFDYQKQLLEEMPKVDIPLFLNESLSSVMDVKSIRNNLELLAKVSPENRRKIVEIVKQLQQYQLDESAIISSLKQLAGKEVTFEQNVRQVLKKEIELKKMGVVFFYILKRNKDKKMAIGKQFYDTLIKSPILSDSAKKDVKRVFTSLNRTSLDVRRLFSRYIKDAKLVATAGPKQKFYLWIEPYGVLMQVIDAWNKAISSKPGSTYEQQLKQLNDSMNALNEANLKFTDALGPIANNKDIIQANVYKEKLTPILNFIQDYQIEKALSFITQFIKANSLGVEKGDQFLNLMNEFRKNLIFVKAKELATIIDQLNNANPKEIIPKLELSGRLNPQIYKKLKGEFSDLIKLLPSRTTSDKSKAIKKLQELNMQNMTSLLNTTISQNIRKAVYTIEDKYIEKLNEKEKILKDIMADSIQPYLETIEKRIANLQQASKLIKKISVRAPEIQIGPGEIPAPPPLMK